MVAARVVIERLWISLVLFTTLLCGETFARHDRPWHLENKLNANCLFLDKSNTRTVLSAARSSIGSQDVLDEIAKQVTLGIVSGNQAPASIINNHHASVDLTVFIANYVDNQLMSEDEYWQYYIHCDQWSVAFGMSPPEISIPLPSPMPTNDRNLVDQGIGFFNNACDWVVSQYQQLEFVWIEGMADGPIEAIASNEIEDRKLEMHEAAESAATECPGILAIVRHELNQRWEPVLQMIRRIENSMVSFPVEQLLDDLVFDPFLDVPLQAVSVEAGGIEMH